MVKIRWQPYLVLLAAALSLVVFSGCKDDSETDDVNTELIRVGDSAPEFTLVSASGHQFSSSELHGKVYLLSFFDTGCSDCRKELPVLQQIYDRYKESVRVITVPRSQSLAEAQEYWANAGLTLPLYTPSDPALYYRFARRGIPRTYVVDAQGVVRAVMTDSPLASFATIEDAIRPLIDTQETDGDDYVNLTMHVKASALNAIDPYFKNEYLISHFELYLFDSVTKQFVTKAVVTDLTPYDDEKNGDRYDISYLIQGLKVKVGVYDIFAVANYYNMPDDITEECQFLNTIDTESYAQGIEPYIPEEGAIMTSHATDHLNIDLTVWSGREYHMSIELERVVAKLQIGVSQESFQLKHNNIKYADVNVTNYKFVNLNKSFYLFQHTDYLSSLGEKPKFQMPDNFNTYNDRGNQYVVDPLFYEKKPDATSAANFKNHYVAWFGEYDNSNFAPIPTSGTYGYAYILENTAFNASQKNGYSTGIVFQASISPVYVNLYDNKTHSLVREYRPEYWGEVIYAYKFKFYGSIQAINADSELQLDELATYTDEQLKTFGIKKCLFNQGVYETYYTYWIRHRNSATEQMGPMQYGIVRNNFYKLIVTGVSGIGNSVITPDLMRDNYPNSYVDVEVN